MSFDQYPDRELGHLLLEVNKEAADYANESLALATVDVSVEQCDYPFNDLPPELRGPFAEIGYPTKNISRLDMQLNYDRAEQFFSPREVMLFLDNGLRMSFSRIHNLAGLDVDERTKHWGLFYPQILTQAGRSLVKPEKTTPVTAELLDEMLQEIGVTVPTAPQRAEWDAIRDMLHFSDRWTAVARHNIQLDLVTNLFIEERTDGRGINAESAIQENMPVDTMARVMEITVALDTASKPAEKPVRSIKYLLRTDEEDVPLQFAGVESVPLTYEPEFLGQFDTVRIERTDKSEFVLPNPDMLRKFITAIEQARTLAES